MPAPVLQFKRGNAGVGGTVPALRPGEPAISLNNFDFFIGIDTSVANNKFFGSHRYWRRENGTNSLNLKLVDKDGSNYVAIKSPDTLAGIVTYTLPVSPQAGYYLQTDEFGTLNWVNLTGGGISFSGITTFANSTDNTLGNADTGAVQIDGGLGVNKNVTVGAGLSVNGTSYFIGITTFSNATDNTLGNADTGAVQIDGGLGVNKNVTVGGNLNVQGYSEFVGVVTFKGGTINLGDSNTDNINVGGEFISNLTPNDDNTYDIGIGTQRWRNANFAGIITASSFVGSITGTASTATRATTVDTTVTSTNSDFYIPFVTNATSTTGETIRVDAGLKYNPSSNDLTVDGNIQVNGNLIKSSTGATAITLAANDVTVADDLTVQGNLYVNGSTTQVNTSSLKVEDRTIDLGIVDGAAPASSTTWDLGVLFNYYTAGAAKKSAVIWEHGDTRFKFAKILDADSDGTDANTPQLTVNTFAPIEVAELWINNSCTSGSSQVIACSGSDLVLQNILVDAGTF
jgi:hypothetical protein